MKPGSTHKESANVVALLIDGTVVAFMRGNHHPSRRFTMTTFTRAARSAAFAFALALPGAATLSAQAASPAPVARHHSKIKGALVGAAAGHVLGGHTKSGAVIGAMVQHHRNKKAK